MKIISLFFIAVLTIAARADIVYLSNGGEIEGKATRKGDHVIIETPEGKTRTVAEKDVLYIAVGPIRKHSSSSKPTSGKSGANRAADHPDRISLPAGGAAGGAIPISQLSQPESIIFILMRTRPAAEGVKRAQLEERIHHFRILAHDRKRQVRGEWFSPDSYIRRRKAFGEILKDAESDIRQWRTTDR